MTRKETVVVICPGRGTYNAAELGYLNRFHSDKSEFIGNIDDYRKRKGLLAISELDGRESYSFKEHTTSENASPLIYACAIADFMDIDRDKYDIVAVSGNSMGWYLALACAGALTLADGLHLVNTMGSMMQQHGRGGQILYPVVDENWIYSDELEQTLKQAIEVVCQDPQVEVYPSIHLGGIEVLAANTNGVKALSKALPPLQDRYPMVLPNHAAFHSPLMQPISEMAKQSLAGDVFTQPEIPLIDGLGRIWQPYSTDPSALYHYTLETQVYETYHYSNSITTAIKEFAPDRLIILGPGTTLGAPTAQVLIRHQWDQLCDKQSFIDRQSQDPYILSMGIEVQRALVC